MPESQTVSLSPLDSQRFGFPVARADGVVAEAVPELLSFIRQQGIELVIARSDGGDLAAARALARAGMVELEAQITYEAPVAPGPEMPQIREGVAEDAAEVEGLARSGFRDLAGHYHADPGLPIEACREIYVDWALRGLAGEAADVFYVAELDGRLAAFGFFTQSGEEVTFQLSTVASWARGRGLYVGFLHRGMTWGSGQGAKRLIGITAHGNIPAQRNLIATGLRPVRSTATFHGWRAHLTPSI